MIQKDYLNFTQALLKFTKRVPLKYDEDVIRYLIVLITYECL